MKKPFLRALHGETISPSPIWLMRQAGRYLPEYMNIRKTVGNFLDFCYTPDLAVEVTLQPLRRYHFDAAILFSDILVIPDALGQDVSFSPGEGPQLEPIRDLNALETLSVSGIHQHLAPVYEVLRRLSSQIPDKTALIGFSGAPWTVATYMVEGKSSKDYAEVRGWAYRSPREFSRLIDILVNATSAYLIEQVANGAEALQIFDSWAGILPEKEFHRWVIEPTKKIVDTVRASCPGVPIIGFPRGAGALYRDFVIETKVDGVSLDSSVPLKWAHEEIQPHCTVQGNMDNLLLVAGGEEMEKEARRIIDILGSGPFIFNLGHGIVPQTPPEHVDRLVNVVRSSIK